MALFDFNSEKLLASPFAIGLAGAIIALRGAPGITWLDRFINATSGTLIAGFMTPAVAMFFGMHTPVLHSGIAFMLGLFGMNITSAINEWIQTAKLSDVIPWMRRGD